uniref:Uncharacterized protein n=1 Tax=Leersia perrieri TaxID=77586 RepID=A0A0D9WM39_9ORYZ
MDLLHRLSSVEYATALIRMKVLFRQYKYSVVGMQLTYNVNHNKASHPIWIPKMDARFVFQLVMHKLKINHIFSVLLQFFCVSFPSPSAVSGLPRKRFITDNASMISMVVIQEYLLLWEKLCTVKLQPEELNIIILRGDSSGCYSSKSP